VLDLELIGPARAVADADGEPERAEVTPLKLRESHHAAARLVARGLSNEDISLQIGYSPTTVSQLRGAPAFQELVAFYRADAERVASDFTAKAALVSLDLLQELHSRLIEKGDDLADPFVLDAFKVIADRAGFAPIQRSVSKNLNVNIGDRMDAIQRKKA
jgi:hypothetical protein